MDLASIKDPSTLLDALDPETIRQQLADLDSRARALRVLLRAAIVRGRRRDSSGASEARPHAHD
jgi:hypothetical protein